MPGAFFNHMQLRTSIGIQIFRLEQTRKWFKSTKIQWNHLPWWWFQHRRIFQRYINPVYMLFAPWYFRFHHPNRTSLSAISIHPMVFDCYQTNCVEMVMRLILVNPINLNRIMCRYSYNRSVLYMPYIKSSEMELFWK